MSEDFFECYKCARRIEPCAMIELVRFKETSHYTSLAKDDVVDPSEIEARIEIPQYDEFCLEIGLPNGGELALCQVCYIVGEFGIKDADVLHDIHFEAGNQFSSLGRAEDALNAWERALAFRTSARVLASLGWLQGKAGFIEKSVRFYQQAVEFEPHNPAYLFALASVLIYEQKKYDEGLQLIERLCQTHPTDDVIASDKLAAITFTALLAADRKDEARQVYEKALESARDPLIRSDLEEWWQHQTVGS